MAGSGLALELRVSVGVGDSGLVSVGGWVEVWVVVGIAVWFEAGWSESPSVNASGYGSALLSASMSE